MCCVSLEAPIHYLIYETRCLVNGKTYVGKHQTRDVNDGYVGSDKLLRRAIKKHGAGNFVTRSSKTEDT